MSRRRRQATPAPSRGAEEDDREEFVEDPRYTIPTIKLREEKPQEWFDQYELNFRMKGITSGDQKVMIMRQSLTEAQRVRLDLPTLCAYQTLVDRVMRAYKRTNSQRLAKFYSVLPKADEMPSLYLSRLKNELDENGSPAMRIESSEPLQWFFIQKLEPKSETLDQKLADMFEAGAGIEEIADAADRFVINARKDSNQAATAVLNIQVAAQSPPRKAGKRRAEEAVEEEEVTAADSSVYHIGTKRTKSAVLDRRGNQGKQAKGRPGTDKKKKAFPARQSTLCSAHYKYGDKAYSCTAPGCDRAGQVKPRPSTTSEN